MPLYLTDNGQAMDKMAAFFDGYRACLDDICDRVGAAVIIAAVPVKIGGLPRRRGQEKIIEGRQGEQTAPEAEAASEEE